MPIEDSKTIARLMQSRWRYLQRQQVLIIGSISSMTQSIKGEERSVNAMHYTTDIPDMHACMDAWMVLQERGKGRCNSKSDEKQMK